MEDGVNTMTDAEILADATREEKVFDCGDGRGVGYSWPDGFGFGARIDEYCDEAKAERSAVWFRREHLRRKGLAHAG